MQVAESGKACLVKGCGTVMCRTGRCVQELCSNFVKQLCCEFKACSEVVS